MAIINIRCALEMKELVMTGVAIVVFCGSWKSPCKWAKGMIARINEQRWRSHVVVAKADVSLCPGILTTAGIDKLPAVAMFKDGEKSGEWIGGKKQDDVIVEMEKLIRRSG
jgi:thioredoxin-like negative regulator of GroEL